VIVAPKQTLMRRLAGSLVATAVALPCCTTFVEPTTCSQGASACGGIHDARFCENVAIAVEGADCTALNIVQSKPFCVVTTSACIDTHYAVKDRDCRVTRYQGVRDSAYSDCPPGAPMFINR
jgi:hypothetical protein